MLPTLRRQTNLKHQQEDAFVSYLDTLRNDLSRMFNRWPVLDWESNGELTAIYPVDVNEENGKILVDAEMPGFEKSEIEAIVENDVLHITAEHKDTAEKKNGRSHLHERRYNRIERRFTLPCAVDEQSVKAKYKNGILHLELEKTQKTEAAPIAIE